MHANSAKLIRIHRSVSLAQIERQRSFFRAIETSGWTSRTNALEIDGPDHQSHLSRLAVTAGDKQDDRKIALAQESIIESEDVTPDHRGTSSPATVYSSPQLRSCEMLNRSEMRNDTPSRTTHAVNPHGTNSRKSLSTSHENVAHHSHVALDGTAHKLDACPTALQATLQADTLGRLTASSDKKDDPSKNTDITNVVRTTCSMSCPCLCHKSNQFRTPQFLPGILPSISVNHRNFSGATSCNSNHCKPGSMSWSANVVFPKWFMSRDFQLSQHWDPGSGPEFRLRVNRVCSESAPIFWAARTGAFDHVRRLLDTEEGSVLDASYPEGKTALHVSQLNSPIFWLLRMH